MHDPVKLIQLGPFTPARNAAETLCNAYGEGYRLKSTSPRGDSVLFVLEHTSQRPSRRLPKPGPRPSQVDNTQFLKALGG